MLKETVGPKEIAGKLNEKIRGCINYFKIEGVSYLRKEKEKLDHYLFKQLRRYYGRKSQRRSKLYLKGAYEILKSKYGLINIV